MNIMQFYEKNCVVKNVLGIALSIVNLFHYFNYNYVAFSLLNTKKSLDCVEMLTRYYFYLVLVFSLGTTLFN